MRAALTARARLRASRYGSALQSKMMRGGCYSDRPVVCVFANVARTLVGDAGVLRQVLRRGGSAECGSLQWRRQAPASSRYATTPFVSIGYPRRTLAVHRSDFLNRYRTAAPESWKCQKGRRWLIINLNGGRIDSGSCAICSSVVAGKRRAGCLLTVGIGLVDITRERRVPARRCR